MPFYSIAVSKCYLDPHMVHVNIMMVIIILIIAYSKYFRLRKEKKKLEEVDY